MIAEYMQRPWQGIAAPEDREIVVNREVGIIPRPLKARAPGSSQGKVVLYERADLVDWAYSRQTG